MDLIGIFTKIKPVVKNAGKNQPTKLYWIGMGKTDFLYKSTAGLRRYFDEKGYKYTYMETEGGHIWRNWRVYLTEFAQKIFK